VPDGTPEQFRAAIEAFTGKQFADLRCRDFLQFGNNLPPLPPPMNAAQQAAYDAWARERRDGQEAGHDHAE
jgi:hypothetical protein